MDFAAPGYRSYASGALSGVGGEGTVWSASVPDGSTGAWRLLFSATNMNPSNANNRGNGFLLRCLSAFIGFRLFRTAEQERIHRTDVPGVSVGYGRRQRMRVNSATH